jgi:hypothetical protein
MFYRYDTGLDEPGQALECKAEEEQALPGPSRKQDHPSRQLFALKG